MYAIEVIEKRSAEDRHTLFPNNSHGYISNGYSTVLAPHSDSATAIVTSKRSRSAAPAFHPISETARPLTCLYRCSVKISHLMIHYCEYQWNDHMRKMNFIQFCIVKSCAPCRHIEKTIVSTIKREDTSFNLRNEPYINRKPPKMRCAISVAQVWEILNEKY